MKNEFRDCCGELYEFLRFDGHGAACLREEPPDYHVEVHQEPPSGSEGAGHVDAHTYHVLASLHAQLELLHALNAARVPADEAISVRLSRAALADCLDRLATRLQAVIERIRLHDA